jgi:hypothetical protein
VCEVVAVYVLIARRSSNIHSLVVLLVMFIQVVVIR